MEIPTHQLQWEQSARGHPHEVLQLVKTKVVRPAPHSGDVLIQVKAVAFNQEYKLMHVLPALIRKFPAIPELELSGIIVDSGESSLQVGDEVFAIIPPNFITSGRGALAQYALAKSNHVTLKPKSMPFEQAAGLAACGLTAFRTYFHIYGKELSGKRVFVHGGSSSLGRECIQIGKLSGAYIVTSCSAASEAGVRALGPDEILNYQSSPIHLQLAQRYPLGSSLAFDVILDCIGDANNIFPSCPAFLVPNGKFIQLGGDLSLGVLSVFGRMLRDSLWPTWLGGTPRRFRFFSLQISDSESVVGDLEQLATWADEGKIKVDVDSVHAFDRAGLMEVYERLKTSKARGKVVILV